MEIKVVLYGIARDIIGSQHYELVIDKTMSVESLLSHLKSEFPKLNELKSLLIAVNDEYASDSYMLQDKDEVVLIPPVSGG